MTVGMHLQMGLPSKAAVLVAGDSFALNPVEHEAAPITWCEAGPIQMYAEDPPQATDLGELQVPLVHAARMIQLLSRVHCKGLP